MRTAASSVRAAAAALIKGCRDRSSGDSDGTDPDWDAIGSEIYGCLARSRGAPFFMALDGLWPGVPFGYFEIRTGLDGDILGCCVDVTDCDALRRARPPCRSLTHQSSHSCRIGG